MRSKQTATEANASGAFPGSSAGARRRLAPALYAAFLLFAAFSVSGSACIPNTLFIGRDAMIAINDANAQAQAIAEELAYPNPDLMDIGMKLNALEYQLQTLIHLAPYVYPDPFDLQWHIATRNNR